jgi:ribosomal protein S17
MLTKSQEQLAIIEHAKNMQVGDILKIEASMPLNGRWL